MISSTSQSSARRFFVTAMTVSSPCTIVDADDRRAFAEPRETAAGPRARLDERLEAERERVAVRARRDRDTSPGSAPRRPRGSPVSRGSSDAIATMVSPSFILKSFWIGSP